MNDKVGAENGTAREETGALEIDKSNSRSSDSSNAKRTTPQLSWRDRILKIWHDHSDTALWHTTWVRFGPLSGFCAILLTCASLVASLGILAGSNDQRVERWTAPPSTYLAIFTAIANLSMRYAAYQGVIIAWWNKALRGSTLPSLHRDWSSGTTFRGALRAGRRMGLLGAACLFSTIVVIDGPLLQRASTVTNTVNNDILTLNVTMARQVPHGLTGFWQTAAQLGLPGYHANSAFNSTVPTVNGSVPNNIFQDGNPALYSILRDTLRGAPIGGVINGCPGKCKAKIQAPGLFASSCQEHNVPANAYLQYDTGPVLSGKKAPPLETAAFMVTTNLLVESACEGINLVTGFAVYDQDCTGTLSYRVCRLESGIGEYEISIENDVIHMDTLPTPKFIAFANNTAVENGMYVEGKGHPSTLAGLNSFITLTWVSFVAYFSNDGEVNEFSIGADLPNSFVKYGSDPNCPSYTDPYDYVLNQFNRMMLYTGALAAQYNETYLDTHLDPQASAEDPRPSSKAVVSGQQEDEWNVYHTDYWYFLGAAIVEGVCILFVLPTYWGWWKIGRAVSFSPLEIAKAFESPLLADCNSNSTGSQLADSVDDGAVRYGQIGPDEGGVRSRLAFGDAASVVRPMQGSRVEA